MGEPKNPQDDIVVLQRIRNHIIGYLELAASFQEQLDYQKRVPLINVPNEIIHQWEDWVSPEIQKEYVEPIFSIREQDAIRQFQQTINQVSSDTPDPLPSIEIIQKSAQWENLRIGALEALMVFQERGRCVENIDCISRAK